MTSNHVHPRRPFAHNSVSLRHTPPVRTLHPNARRHQPAHRDSSSDSGGRSGLRNEIRHPNETEPPNDHSPSSLNPLGAQTSSGESSNAEKWFEKSNNEVRADHRRPSFTDDDPPFFMRNSSSSETPPDGRPRRPQPAQDELLHAFLDANANASVPSLPLRTGLLRLGTEGSSNEEYRSVIDDLTIKNKKLKRRLKKYEKLHDSHLKDEKLFEVRFHGLPPAKKRELEETLRKFASGLHTGGANAFPSNGYASLVPMLNTGKATSSQTSLHHTDSAYASMSASNHGSAPQSGADARPKSTTSYMASRRQNIHSYLHDIPEGLLPHPNTQSLSERAKKKFVARRLEGIFAGKDAAKGGHQQPLQQQEVSQSAARADRSAIEATGRFAGQEGAREARIMGPSPPAVDSSGDAATKTDGEATAKRLARPAADARTAANPLEQRPTRPLDLDPQRAQVPAENILYMRHLGFSPLDPETASIPEDGHGWIYLNFLINMAQLHTLNVTPEFVRKALNEYSHMLEISPDARKVRWRGGEVKAHLSSGGDTSSHGRTSDNTPDGHTPMKPPKLSHNGSYSESGGHGGHGRTASEVNRYAYTPLFFHRDSTDDADDSSDADEDSVSSPLHAPIGGDSSGMTSSGMHTSSGMQTVNARKKSKRDDGPIIFYNNANFCTDLSGDSRLPAAHEPGSYTTATGQPIGMTPESSDDLFETRGPLAEAVDLPEPMNLCDNPIPASMELGFPQRSPLGVDSCTAPVQIPIDLEVAGIGGVFPEDNFTISVASHHALVEPTPLGAIPPSLSPGGDANTKAIRPPPNKFASILQHSPIRIASPAIHHRAQILATKLESLAPSPLPPAIQYMLFGDESMEDDDDDDASDGDDHMSIAPESPGAFPPSAAPQPVDFHSTSSSSCDASSSHATRSLASSSEHDDSSAADDDSDDGSVDLLAAARQADPEAVREREREYDANMAERLAEEIPAGSSAATAGGGSGFASPASGVTKNEYARARQEARRAASASMALAGVVASTPAASGSRDFGQGTAVAREQSARKRVRISEGVAGDRTRGVLEGIGKVEEEEEEEEEDEDEEMSSDGDEEVSDVSS